VYRLSIYQDGVGVGLVFGGHFDGVRLLVTHNLDHMTDHCVDRNVKCLVRESLSLDDDISVSFTIEVRELEIDVVCRDIYKQKRRLTMTA